MLPIRISSRLIRPLQQRCRYSSGTTQNELTYPASPSSEHHDLTTFLSYASRTEMALKSTVYIGTHYEYKVQSSLTSLGFYLKRVGGHSDHGIDLLGTWSLPSSSQPWKVLVQCKALAKKISPAQARELEGSFVGAPEGWRGDGVLALLVAPLGATKGVREALGRSRWPMGYVMCSAEGRVSQMLWNRRAEEEGLEGIGVGLKYGGGEGVEKEVYLTWKGEPIQHEGS